MKKITKKLSLNKVNLTELDKNQMNNVKGGEGDINADFTSIISCHTHVGRRCSGCQTCCAKL
jgi:natural product precursor